MKTFFTFLLSVVSLLSFGQYSQVNSHTVTINFKGDKNFMAVIDGQTFYSDGKDGRWDDCRDHRHDRDDRDDRENGNDRDDRWDNSRKKRYDDNDIQLNLRPGQHTIAVYKMTDDRNNRNNNGGWNGNRNGRGVSNDNRIVYSTTFLLKQGYSMNFVITGNGRAVVTEDRIRGHRGRNQGGYDNGYPNNRYRTPMADYQFNEIIKDVRSKWFQNAKVTAVRDHFNNTASVFSTLQARQLLLLISSENDRLELAKLAYRNIADPQSFSQLYDIFNSQYSREELDRYTRSQRF